MSTIDADHGLSFQTNSAGLVLGAYRKMLLFLFPDASTIVAILVILIFLPYSAQNTAGQSIPIFPVIMAGTICAFFSSFDDTKAILWGFVAGFAGRMVPNFLDHGRRMSARRVCIGTRCAGPDRQEGGRTSAVASRAMPASDNPVGISDVPGTDHGFPRV